MAQAELENEISADGNAPSPDTDGDQTSSQGDPNRHTTGTRFTAEEIYDNVRVAADEELKRPSAALFWSALAAGLTIGFSFFAGAYLSSLVAEPYRESAAAVGYPLGFIFVVMARNQLFTENTLEPIIPLLHCPKWPTLQKLLSLWIIVLIGNMIGAIIFAAIAADTPIVEPHFKTALLRLAEHSTSGGFGIVIYRAIYAGWLIALMAWLVASTHATFAQLALIWLTTAPIAAFGFRHSIAGAVEAFYRAFVGSAGWGDMLANFVLPAIIGNIIGGVTFVALLNHGQVAADRAAKASKESGNED
ncbi:MAG: formate/nitrite transporter family protein [Abitibacteriaceae bacterium]|nr:formate/nitrite transporter family protein [Abditibacteriaceae bacterium]